MATTQRRSTRAPVVAAIPFTAAAHEHQEPISTTTCTPGTTIQSYGPFDVPAYGYLRNIWLRVTGSGGALGGGALNADYPFNIFSNLQLNDVNGAPIFGPMDGFAALQSNVWGGYANRSDPRQSPTYVGTIDTEFFIRIPVEISRHNALGAIANQNAAAAFKLYFSVNTLANLVTGGAPTAPALSITTFLEAWSLPNETDLAGRPQAQLPPAHGTSQYWSYFNKSTAAGANTVLLPRVGNLLRNVIIIARTAAGARADNVYANPATLSWDARQILANESQNYRVNRAAEALENGATRDTGVFPYFFNNLDAGKVGDEEPNLWLPTVQSTRLELSGSAAAAGSWQILTNDIAPVEVVPEERYVETSATGFHPNVGVPVTS